MSFDILFDFFKKINYKRFLPLFLCPVLFLCTSISGFALNMNDLAVSGLVNSYYLGSTAENNQLRFIVWSGSTTSYDKQISLTGNNIYQLDNAAFSSASTFRIGTPSVRFDFPYVSELYDYYILINYYSKNGDVSFVPSSVGTYDYSDYPNSRRVWFEEFYILPSSDSTNKGFRVLAKLPDIENFSFNVVDLVGSGTLASNMIVEGLIFCFDKNSDSGASSIIAAINNQTTQQNNNFNDFMNSGSGFGGTSSGILSGNDELSGFIDDYTEVEQSMYDKFTENQSAVIDNFSGFAWGSLSTAVDWTSDYLNRIYDNSGDFRTMFMYPILAGIALIFIGRQGLTAYVRSRREK